MPATSFDFDVITGPSTPREERDAPRPQSTNRNRSRPSQAGGAANAVTAMSCVTGVLVAASLA